MDERMAAGLSGRQAFDTAAGRKVTTIKLNGAFLQCSANAFYNTKSLTSLQISPNAYYYKKSNKGGTVTKVAGGDNCKIGKKAFSRCGKGGGKRLVVFFKDYNDGVIRNETPAFKKLLTSHGMPSKAKLKISKRTMR